MTETRYEMLWDCAACGTKKLLGVTHRCCPGCGSPQDAKARYFPPVGEEVAVKGHPFVGADRHCPFCSSAQSAAAKFCTGCGGDLDGAKAVARIVDGASTGPATSPGVTSPQAQSPVEARGSRRASSREVSETPSTALRWVKRTVLGAVALGVAFVVLAFVDHFWTKPVTYILQSHTWSREIDVETFSVQPSGDWCGAMPGDAYGVSRSQRQRGTTQEADGETCHTVREDNGDGSFSSRESCSTKYKSVPVYDTWCDYKVNRWVVTDTRRVEGKTKQETPQWPSLAGLKAGNGLGAERSGERRESYKVQYVSQGATPEDRDEEVCELPQGDWEARELGASFTAQKGMIFGVVACDTFTARGAEGATKVAH